MAEVFGVDIDDVLFNFHQAFIEFCNARYGTNLKITDFTDPDINKPWCLSKNEVTRRINEFNAIDGERHLLPRSGSQKMIRKLARQGKLHAITNRPIEIRENTMWSLDEHFPNMFSEVHFCTKNGGETMVHSKNSVCKRIRAAILLEDHLFNTEKCVAAGIHVYLFDQPWNRHEPTRQQLAFMPGAVISVKDWHDPVLETLCQ